MVNDHDDIVLLFDYTWGRFHDRMAGLTDDEWRWQPTGDDDLSLRWRLAHITHVLAGDRNGPWLGLPEETPEPPAGTDAATALASAATAYARWHKQLTSLPADGLAAPVGPVGGVWADSTRRAFALHIVDELIHHTAEAALFRDLYAAR